MWKAIMATARAVTRPAQAATCALRRRMAMAPNRTTMGSAANKVEIHQRPMGS